MKDKRYYWLKLEENYFDLKVQKALRKLPSGADMLICYLKMQLKYLNKAGLIEYQGIYDNLVEEIALDIDEEVDIVKMTIAMLIKWNVIEEEDSNLYLSEMQTRIGSKTDSAVRVAKHREKLKMLQCNNDVTKCNSIQEIEKDIEIEIEKDIEKENFTDTQKKKTNNITYFLKIISNNNYKYIKENNDVYNKITEWLNYKQERKELYKEIGLKNLLKQIDSKIDNYGEKDVINLISECMANNYKGIIFDKISKKEQGTKKEYKSFREMDYDRQMAILRGESYE